MSDIATLVDNVHKEWLNPRINNLTVDGTANITTLNVPNINITTATIDNLNSNNAVITTATITNANINEIATECTFPTGISFGDSVLSSYDYLVVTGTWSGVWAAPIEGLTVHYLKIGSLVTITIESLRPDIPANTAARATFSVAVLPQYRPYAGSGDSTVIGFLPVVDNGASGAGTWNVSPSTGILTIGGGLGASTNFTGLSTSGGTGWYNYSFSYLTQ